MPFNATALRLTHYHSFPSASSVLLPLSKPLAGWLTAAQPDPQGCTLRAVRRSLRTLARVSECGLFVDWSCIPQKPRTEDEEVRFKNALSVMLSLYASVTGTTVL